MQVAKLKMFIFSSNSFKRQVFSLGKGDSVYKPSKQITSFKILLIGRNQCTVKDTVAPGAVFSLMKESWKISAL